MKLVFITLTAVLFTLISKMGHAEQKHPTLKNPSIVHTTR